MDQVIGPPGDGAAGHAERAGQLFLSVGGVNDAVAFVADLDVMAVGPTQPIGNIDGFIVLQARDRAPEGGQVLGMDEVQPNRPIRRPLGKGVAGHAFQVFAQIKRSRVAIHRLGNVVHTCRMAHGQAIRA